MLFQICHASKETRRPSETGETVKNDDGNARTEEEVSVSAGGRALVGAPGAAPALLAEDVGHEGLLLLGILGELVGGGGLGDVAGDDIAAEAVVVVVG